MHESSGLSGRIRKMEVYEEYFYWGEKLFFAYIWYDETSEYYYYNDGELIRWIDSNGKCHDNETDNEEFVKAWREILE